MCIADLSIMCIAYALVPAFRHLYTPPLPRPCAPSHPTLISLAQWANADRSWRPSPAHDNLASPVPLVCAMHLSSAWVSTCQPGPASPHSWLLPTTHARRHLSILLLLLQHSANLDLQSNHRRTAMVRERPSSGRCGDGLQVQVGRMLQ